MNEPAIRLEEQMISLFSDRETRVCEGWILKEMEEHLFVYPLYYKFSQENIPDNVQKCEEISRQSGAGCVFRIVEHTNYYLSSILTNRGYILEKCGVVGEWNLTENMKKSDTKRSPGRLFLKNEAERNKTYVMAETGAVVGIKRQGFLFLPDGNLPEADIENMLRFSVENGITQVLADLPKREDLPEAYERAGFHKAYLYRCYQKED